MDESKRKISQFSNNIFLCQLYYFLFNGIYQPELRDEYIKIEEEGIFKLEILKANPNFSSELIGNLNDRLNQVKAQFIAQSPYRQKCGDDDLIQFWRTYSLNQKILRVDGIRLYDFLTLFDITDFLRNGYFLQDLFCGYQAGGDYEYKSDCLDILNSAIYYYNEAYDYENGLKVVLDYSQIDADKLKCYEMKRIYTAEEVTFKNYREAYINLLFFIEAFINSVGYNAILESNSYTPEQINRLHGFSLSKRNNRILYSNISKKMEDIAFIISGIKIDLNQSPYKDYVKSEVEIRNKYIHSSPYDEKVKLNYTRINWKDKCLILIETFTLEILEAFWKHCYPKRNFPPYIFNGFCMGTFKGFQSKGVLANK